MERSDLPRITQPVTEVRGNRFVAFAVFCGVNSPTMADFKLPQSREEMLTVDSHKPE